MNGRQTPKLQHTISSLAISNWSKHLTQQWVTKECRASSETQTAAIEPAFSVSGGRGFGFLARFLSAGLLQAFVESANVFDVRLSQKGSFPARHVPYREEETLALEQKLGCRLPEDYRHFLEKFGHTTFRGYVVYPNFRRPEKDGGGVESFHGFNPSDSRDLVRAWKGSTDQIPLHYLPIATGPGYVICLDLTEPNRGAVFEHLLDSDNEGGDLEKDMHMIWPDFDGFMRNLRPLTTPIPSP